MKKILYTLISLILLSQLGLSQEPDLSQLVKTVMESLVQNDSVTLKSVIIPKSYHDEQLSKMNRDEWNKMDSTQRALMGYEAFEQMHSMMFNIARFQYLSLEVYIDTNKLEYELEDTVLEGDTLYIVHVPIENAVYKWFSFSVGKLEDSWYCFSPYYRFQEKKSDLSR